MDIQNISIQQIVFYFFSTLSIASAAMVVISKNSVRAVLFLIFTFFCMAGLWMLLQSEFLAIVLVLVYVGAVMVLFLFVVMMLDVEAPQLQGPFVFYWPLGLVVAGFMMGLMIMAVGKHHFGLDIIPMPAALPSDYSSIKVLGRMLYSDFLLPFEIAGVLLLVAMIAAIGLTFRGARGTKSQKPGKQVLATKADRLRIVSMPSETGDQA